MKTQLLIIDPQVDFCDLTGALFVKGADEDSKRLASMITRSLDMIEDMRVTLDSHQPVHIAHPICWVDKNGNHPNPFTIIGVSDVEGKDPAWKAFNPAWQNRQVEYVKALATGGRYILCIWPVHCLISTPGATVTAPIGEALRAWQNQFAMIDFVTKGSNPFTEHYSVVRADVVDPNDPTTDINMSFIRRLQEADQILIAGQALSHCVANSVTDIATEFGDDHVKKLVLLEDACSPVPGFENLADGFLTTMIANGMRVAKTTDF
jgi:nicotinamidase-related amidase